MFETTHINSLVLSNILVFCPASDGYTNQWTKDQGYTGLYSRIWQKKVQVLDKLKKKSSNGRLVCFFDSGNSIVSGGNFWCPWK